MNVYNIVCLIINLRQVLARWAADMAPCDDAVAITETVSASDLSTSGVRYKMQNIDTPFDPLTGELVGHYVTGGETADLEHELETARAELEDLRELSEVDELTAAEADEMDDLEATVEALAFADGDHRNPYNTTSEGVADTTELGEGYWDAIAASHLAEMRRERSLERPAKGDLSLMHGTMEFWQAQREARFDRLRRMAKRLAKARDAEKLAKLKAGVASRYEASNKLVRERGKNEFFLLYLTSAQVSYLQRV